MAGVGDFLMVPVLTPTLTAQTRLQTLAGELNSCKPWEGSARKTKEIERKMEPVRR